MVNERAINLSGYLMLVAVFLFFIAIQFFDTPFSFVSFSGRAIATDTGIVNVTVLAANKVINIHSPLNITYNFSREDPYLISLNVTAEFTADAWRYSLYDVENDVWEYTNVPFVPNSSFVAVRRQNLLRVEAHEVDANWNWAQVYFFVFVNDSAPIISNISDNLYVCEGENLFVDYNGTDLDGDQLTSSITNPNPFFVAFVSFDGINTTYFRLVSGQISKSEVGGIGGIFQTYEKTISVFDTVPLSDSRDANITAIEVNNPPVLNNQLGAQTLWTQGENSTFTHQYNTSDIEDGDSPNVNLTFNLSFGLVSNLFDINSSTGLMNYTAQATDVGIYNLVACVNDTGMLASHQNFSVCSGLGYHNDSASTCDSFSLTITDANRPPEILNYSPVINNLATLGTNPLTFYAEVKDPDGTVPDIDWYVNDNLVSHNENLSNHTFEYTFGCGISGLYNVTLLTTDGLLNDSAFWNVTVSFAECPPSVGGGGGGGGGATICYEDWQCEDWRVCQNTKRSYDSGILSVEDYDYLREVCAQSGYDDDRFCGFQVRSCMDINDCQNTELRVNRSSERQVCYYTEDPSCFDGITNCHSGGCEVLVDCGGPCNKCPTCSDGIQNQGEEDIDCGGPCPYLCEREVPFGTVAIVLTVVSGIMILVIAVYGIRLLLITYKRKREYLLAARAQGIKR